MAQNKAKKEVETSDFDFILLAPWFAKIYLSNPYSVRLFPRCPTTHINIYLENIETVSRNHHFVASQKVETKSQLIKLKARRLCPELWWANIFVYM